MSEQAEFSVLYGNAYVKITEAIELMDRAGRLHGLVGVGLISHAGPVLTAREHAMNLLRPYLNQCTASEIEAARKKVLGE